MGEAEDRAAKARELFAYYAQGSPVYNTDMELPEGGTDLELPAGAPPPPKPSFGQRAKDAAIIAGGTILGGPAGAMAAQNYTTPAPGQPPPPPAAGPPPNEDPIGPPRPPPQNNAPPLILPPQRGGIATPAGMYPHTMSTQSHEGKPVPTESRAAFDAADALSLDAAEKQRDAERAYQANIYNAQRERLQAAEEARAQHAAIQVERQKVTNDHLSRIEALNAEANTNVGPSTNLAAGILGAIGIALGAYAQAKGAGPNVALQLIESNNNRELQRQIENRRAKGQAAERAQNLYHLHLSALGDKDKAADATKLALYDNNLMQLESYRAQHGVDMADANYLKLQAGILEKRGELRNKMGVQEAADVTRGYTEQWRPATYAAGAVGRPALPEPGHTVVLPPSNATEGKGAGAGKPVRVSIKEPATAERLQKEAAVAGRLMDINNKAIVARNIVRDAAKNPSWDKAGAAANARKELLRLEQEKVKLVSSKDMQGVLKEAEYFRSIDIESGFTDIDIVGNTNARLQRENEHLYDGLNKSVEAAGGSVVEQGFQRDPKTGTLRKFEAETGQLYEPSAVMPEQGKVK